jgi:hypothetical protein
MVIRRSTVWLAIVVLSVGLLQIRGAAAQELHLVENQEKTAISDPEIYQAFYGNLVENPHIYTFAVDSEFPLALTILVPDTDAAAADLRLELIDERRPNEPAGVADGAHIEWTRFFDTAGRNWYLAGPRLEASVPPGTYAIRVSSASATPYVLIIEGDERFSLIEVFRRFSTVPAIKSQFFNASPLSALATPLLIIPMLGIFSLIALVLGFFVFRKFRTR